MPGLRDSPLPRQVEVQQQQKRQSTSSEVELDPDHKRLLRMSQSSVTDSSPLSPTFSLQGHSRFPSSGSSLAGSPSMRSSFDGYASKRPLTEVREEPHERETDFELLDAPISESEELDRLPSTSVSEAIFTAELDDSQADYEWVDGPYGDEHFELSMSKRRRADDSPLDSPTLRISGGLKSLSQKWKSRKEKRFSSLPDSFHESIASRSRASSMRSPSVIGQRESLDYADSRLPQTLSPADSFVEDVQALVDSPETPEDDVEELEDDAEEEEAAKEASRTPLLPPVMCSLKRETSPVQSPLQSPKIAGSPAFVHSDSLDSSTSAWNGLPSPPLSNKPSISSFHHRPVVPSQDIPPFTLAEPQDEWALKLGHANFTIYPEPYLLQLPASMEACARLRQDWDEARANYAKHLARTREHYSTKSRVHELTEQKWAETNGRWQTSVDEAVASASVLSFRHASSSSCSYRSLSHAECEVVPEVRIPAIKEAQLEGKFPTVGEVGIVGPMKVLKPVDKPEQGRPMRKRAFWKFLQGMLPSSVAFGRSSA